MRHSYRHFRPNLERLEDRIAPADATYTLVNSWNSGQQAEIAITNPTGPSVNGWRIGFDYAGEISQAWNARLVSHVGNHYEFADVGWNASIPVGGKAAFGFISNLSTAADHFTLNGQPLGGGSPPPAVTVSVTGGASVEGDPSAPASGAGFLRTSGNQIVDQNGNPVKLSGVNWFGMENNTYAPHGLWTRGYKDMMDQMKQLGFNLIRLPFASQTLEAGSMANGIDFSLNPDLQGLNGQQVMDKIIAYAGQIGLRVMLDHHRSSAGAGADSGLWYEGAYTDARFVSDWQALAARYANNPTVIGADLHNEPHGAATWGSGNVATDWRLAAERAGNAILSVNPNWLIVVEGVESGPSGNYWWGGNLSAAGANPVRLNVPGRLVYSPHDYPASVFNQPWFSDSNYPNNLAAVWDRNWGYLFRTGTAPLLLGEFGSKLETASDRAWFAKITQYLGGDLDTNGTNDLAAGQQGISWTFWSWNPNSGDTGGILNDDWRTVRQDKVDALRPIQGVILGGGGAAAVNTITFTVQLSAASTSQVQVAYRTQDGSALAGSDYTAASGTLVFAPGETSKTIKVSLVPDKVAEPTETFSLLLSNPVGATVATGAATGTITDDDSAPPPPPPPTPSLSVADVRQNEGNAANTFTFTIRLSAASATAVTVRYRTEDVTATAGSDYTGASGTVTFAPGETVKTVAIAIAGDTTVEMDEVFRLLLSEPSGATVATGTATATLTNDDTAPPPPPSSGKYQVTPTVRSNWGTGIVTDVLVKNTGSQSWTGWTLTFDADFEITNIWGAQIVSHVGTRYVLRAADYTRSVGANGGSVQFGFQASVPPGASTALRNVSLTPTF